MRFRSLYIIALSLMLFGCHSYQKTLGERDLNSDKANFLNAIFSSDVEEGPFALHYSLETVFFSKKLVSLFGQLDVYECLPHGKHRYEGKTFILDQRHQKEISLEELFALPSQKEFLRSYCEEALKNDPISYFSGNKPLKIKLEAEELQTFVIDHQSLIIIFQPYVVGGGEDGPFFVKIPFEKLSGHWDSNNIMLPLLSQVIASKDFVIAKGMFYQRDGQEEA
jgi:hypothetical protein